MQNTEMQFEEKYFDYHLDYDKECNAKGDGNISPTLEKSIKDIIKKEDYTTYNLDIKVLPANGGNYLATLVEVNVNGNTKKGEKETNIFVKNIIPEQHMTVLSVSDAYYKEMFAYTELFKIYTQLQDEADIPTEERFQIVKSYDESNLECIILENIAKKGFVTLNRLETIPLRFAELSVQQLAKFHGLSFVLQKKNKEYFNRKVKCIKPGFFFNDEFNKFIENFANIAMENVNNETKQRIKDLIPVIIKKFPKYFLDESPVMCLCHGDYRSNNIMMRMTDGEITDVVPVDYQLLYYGCPLNDFFYFLIGATDQQFRKDHMEDMKNMYHDTLTKFLKYFDMDVEDYFPRKTFEKLYKERLEYGLLNAIWFLPVVLAADDDFPDFSKECPSEVVFKTAECLKPRLEGVIDDYVKWGYL